MNWLSVRLPSKLLLRAGLAALLLSPLLLAQPQPAETERLLATGKLWVTVKYFHPYLAYRRIDWDQALVDALPKIRSAGNAAEYRAAIQSMLDALHDPATYTRLDRPQPGPASLQIEKRPDGGLIVSQSNIAAPNQDAVQELAKAITAAHNIVFDLRAGEFLSALLDRSDIRAILTSSAIDAPAQRLWIHNGLPPTSGMLFGGYHSAFYTEAGVHIPGTPAAAEHKIAFFLNENSELPAVGSALFANGKAAVFTESAHYQVSGVETAAIAMGQGIEAVVRLSESVPSLDFETVSHDSALPQALAALAKPFAPPQAKLLPFSPAPQPDRDYAENRYPSPELRILAAYKIWAVFRYFFAYRDLMDEDWDDVFTTFLPKFIAAKDAREYNLTIAEMVTHVADSHAQIQSEELSDYFGKAPVGLRLRLIEKKPLITEILDEEAKKAGIQVGDIVSKVDGESIIDRFHREELYIAASTPQRLGFSVIQRILNGPEGSIAVLTIGGQDGRTREVSLKRSITYSTALRNQRSGDVIRLLPGDIGYADLDRLMPEQVDGMFDEFRDTKAIIFDMRGFDMRGYPRGTAWSIAPRLTGEKDVATAIVTGPLALTPDVARGEFLSSTASYFWVSRLPTHR